MEAIPVIAYRIENNPEPYEFGTVIIHTDFITNVDMDPIPTPSTFSSSLSTKEFIEDVESPRKQELCHFLTESRVGEVDAIRLMQILIRLAIEVTSSDEYFSHYALSMWLTLDIVPLSESDLDVLQIEEAIRVSLDDYERNIRFRPASKLRVRSLSRRIFKRKRKTNLIADRKTKRKTCSTADRCTICLEEFRTGRKIVSLPCGHEFDDRCVVTWFKINHVCPLCRFELPCEDDGCASTAAIKKLESDY